MMNKMCHTCDNRHVELSVNGCIHGFDNTLQKESNLAKKICSSTVPFAESHTAENLLLALESAFSEYKIKKRLHLVVRDNAANIVKSR